MSEENERVKWVDRLDHLVAAVVENRFQSQYDEAYEQLKEMARLADRYEETQRPIGYQED